MSETRRGRHVLDPTEHKLHIYQVFEIVRIFRYHGFYFTLLIFNFLEKCVISYAKSKPGGLKNVKFNISNLKHFSYSDRKVDLLRNGSDPITKFSLEFSFQKPYTLRTDYIHIVRTYCRPYTFFGHIYKFSIGGKMKFNNI